MPNPGEAYWAVKIMKGFLQPYVIGLKCLMVQHAPRLFLRPVGPELLEVGTNICDVLVVLDPDERHSSARHLLHWRANVFVESLFVQVMGKVLNLLGIWRGASFA